MKKADYTVDITADKEGYVHHIQSELIGEASMILGGGRQNKEDKIDHYVGVVLFKEGRRCCERRRCDSNDICE